MKNIKLAIITILITVFSTGCSSWLDDIAPRNAIPQSALTDSDLEKLLNGLYATMESYVFTYWWADDLQGENFKGGPRWRRYYRSLRYGSLLYQPNHQYSLFLEKFVYYIKSS